MKTGGCHERTRRFYAGWRWGTSRNGRMGLDLCRGRAPRDAPEAGAGLESVDRSDGQTLAGRGQKCGWRAGVALARACVCTLIGLDVGQGVSLAADGGVSQRERPGAALSRSEGRRAEADPRSLFNRA